MAEKKKVKPPVEQLVDADARKKALKMALDQISKQFGKDAILSMGSQPDQNLDVVSTGSFTLDLALGVGGLPRGRIVEIYGPESSGKTTLTLHILAEMQKLGGTCAFIDAEHALDVKYAKALGVKVDDLLLSQPDSGEQALEIAEALIRSGAIDVIVLDSIAAMTTRAEIDGEMGDLHVGQLARLMSQAMRKLTAAISKSNCVAIFINQIREKIGVMYGNPETTPGGRALKFYSSVRIEVRKGEVIKSGSDIIGANTKCKVVKNKVAPPFKECTFDLMYGTGISRTGEVLDLAVDLDIIKKGGSWFSYKDQKLGQGRDNVKELLKNDEALMKEIEEKVKENSANIVMVSKKSKKAAAKNAASQSAADNTDEVEAAEASEPTAAIDIDIDADDDYEEFTPVDTD